MEEGPPSDSVAVARTLRAHLVRCEAQKRRSGWKELPAWVFVNENGNPLDPDLRNTYASLLIGQRESLAYVKEQICHHSTRVTVDTYGCLVSGGNKARIGAASGTTGGLLHDDSAPVPYSPEAARPDSFEASRLVSAPVSGAHGPIPFTVLSGMSLYTQSTKYDALVALP